MPTSYTIRTEPSATSYTTRTEPTTTFVPLARIDMTWNDMSMSWTNATETWDTYGNLTSWTERTEP